MLRAARALSCCASDGFLLIRTRSGGRQGSRAEPVATLESNKSPLKPTRLPALLYMRPDGYNNLYDSREVFISGMFKIMPNLYSKTILSFKLKI
jgi:hypothetical protein